MRVNGVCHEPCKACDGCLEAHNDRIRGEVLDEVEREIKRHVFGGIQWEIIRDCLSRMRRAPDQSGGG